MPDDRIQRLAEAIAPLRVEPGRRVRLDKDYDPRYKAGIVKKKDGGQLLQTGVELLAEYQARLAAQDVHSLRHVSPSARQSLVSMCWRPDHHGQPRFRDSQACGDGEQRLADALHRQRLVPRSASFRDSTIQRLSTPVTTQASTPRISPLDQPTLAH
jgi:hypothetical protein